MTPLFVSATLKYTAHCLAPPGIMRHHLGATAIEASTLWGDDIVISSSNGRALVPKAVMADQGFLPVITLLGVLQLPHAS